MKSKQDKELTALERFCDEFEIDYAGGELEPEAADKIIRVLTERIWKVSMVNKGLQERIKRYEDQFGVMMN